MTGTGENELSQMPPRYSYWTIILGGSATSFRAYRQADLLPTLRQLQSRHPDAVLMWFSRGRLWKSPAEARPARQGRPRRPAVGPDDRRGPDWRPGGKHRDPRARFRKRARPKSGPGGRGGLPQRSTRKRRTRD